MKRINFFLTLVLFSSFVESDEIEFQRIFSPLVSTQSNAIESTNEVPVIFVDPGCNACKKLLIALDDYPQDSYRLVLVSAVPPSVISLSKTLWHLSSGGGIPAESSGCQKLCSSKELIHSEPLFSSLHLQDNNMVVNDSGTPIQDINGNIVFWKEGMGFVDSNQIRSDLGKAIHDSEHTQITWSNESSKPEKIYIESLRADENGVLKEEDLNPVYFADIFLSPYDIVNRFSRLGINSRMMHEAAESNNTEAKVPSVFKDGVYQVITSPNQLNLLIGAQKNVDVKSSTK